ncbi:mitochondrial 54S ribosomal protein YmL41 [Vermiconidia calcicola]|uniref:Mitochondrial 54S ribosomal protein YmL41 n=1 Tax=Vermiconidia calcicola TaxID=1690605 RepID=A0ACC3NQC5_9PEZI|nr:mitochondrial 54S ribosomal protein YmL41 [Vermiconidia calcicola]
MATAAAIAPFRVGLKELYLPDFSVVLHRTPGLPAHNAKFTVPLWFSKLDLRDYLYHAYNVRILSVRSYVKQQRIIEGDPKNPRPQPNRWHRPRALKHMIVELEQPFVWPEEPEDYSAWNREEVKDSEAEQKKYGELMQPMGDAVVNEERRKSMREQAKALLEGRQKWKPTTSRSVGSMLSR